MDNQRLIELTKNSKVSNSNKKEIAQLLTERFQEDHNYGDLINWLFKSHYSVAQVFFEKNTFNDDEAAAFAKALEKSETLRKKGQNHYFCRLWIICSIFMKQKLADETVAEIAYITVDYGQGKKQSEKKYEMNLKGELLIRVYSLNSSSFLMLQLMIITKRHFPNLSAICQEQIRAKPQSSHAICR